MHPDDEPQPLVGVFYCLDLGHTLELINQICSGRGMNFGFGAEALCLWWECAIDPLIFS
jgi:hypothetical protein